MTSDFNCTTELIRVDPEWANDDPNNYIFATGSIFTFMATVNEAGTECNVKYDMDSNGNTVNIFTMLPQYIIITMGEVTILGCTKISEKNSLAFPGDPHSRRHTCTTTGIDVN